MKTNNTQQSTPTNTANNGFTLVELLVVVAIIALLLSITLPSISKAKESGRCAVCASNIHQLGLANTTYALENNDYYVLAAEDIFTGFGGKKRWHGTRLSEGVSSDPQANHFDPALGPLAQYLGSDGQVKKCPSFDDHLYAKTSVSFEEGTGGYGYNQHYIGGRSDIYGFSPKSARNSAQITDVIRPAQTVMFTDTAFAQKQSGSDILIEYSFCEPPYFLPNLIYKTTPSIHFRHNNTANALWADGHVSSESLTFTAPSGAGFTESQMKQIAIGWFGPNSNELFDLN